MESKKFSSFPKNRKITILSNSSLTPRTRRDNNNNDNNNNDKNPHLNFLKGAVLGDKEHGVGIRDNG